MILDSVGCYVKYEFECIKAGLALIYVPSWLIFHLKDKGFHWN